MSQKFKAPVEKNKQLELEDDDYEKFGQATRCPSFLLYYHQLVTPDDYPKKDTIVSCCINTRRQLILTSDNLYLRVWNFHRLMNTKELPATTSTDCLVYNSVHDVYYALENGVHILVLSAQGGRKNLSEIHRHRSAHDRRILCSVLDARHSVLINAGVGGEIYLWKARQLHDKVKRYEFELMQRLGYDGRWVQKMRILESLSLLFVAADTDVLVWDLVQGEVTYHLSELHDLPITDVFYDPSNRHLITSSMDRSIKIWEFERGGLKKVETLLGHMRPIRAMHYDAARRHLFSTGDDGSIRLWHIDQGIEWDSIQAWEFNGMEADCEVPCPEWQYTHELFLLNVESHDAIASDHALITIAGNRIVILELQRCARFLTEASDEVINLQVMDRSSEGENLSASGGGQRDEQVEGYRKSGVGARRKLVPAPTSTNQGQRELVVLTKGSIFQRLDAQLGHVNGVIAPSKLEKEVDANGDAVMVDSTVTAMVLEPRTRRLYTGWSDGQVKAISLDDGAVVHGFMRMRESGNHPVTVIESLPAAGDPPPIPPRPIVYNRMLENNTQEAGPEACPAQQDGATPSTSADPDSMPSTAQHDAVTAGFVTSIPAWVSGGPAGDNPPPSVLPVGPAGLGVQLLAVGYKNGFIDLYELKPDSDTTADDPDASHSGKPYQVKAYTQEVTGIKYMQANQLLLTATKETAVLVWLVRGPRDVTLQAVLQSTDLSVTSCINLQNQRMLLTGHEDGTIATWNLFDLHAEVAQASAVQHPPHTADSSSQVEALQRKANMRGEKPALGLKGKGQHSEAVMAATYAKRWMGRGAEEPLPPDASLSTPGLRLHKLIEATTKMIKHPQALLQGHSQKVLEMCPSECGRFCASSSFDNSVILWDLVTSTCLHVFRFRHPISRLCALNQDFDIMVAIGPYLCILSTQKYGELSSAPDRARRHPREEEEGSEAASGEEAGGDEQSGGLRRRGSWLHEAGLVPQAPPDISTRTEETRFMQVDGSDPRNAEIQKTLRLLQEVKNLAGYETARVRDEDDQMEIERGAAIQRLKSHKKAEIGSQGHRSSMNGRHKRLSGYMGAKPGSTLQPTLGGHHTRLVPKAPTGHSRSAVFVKPGAKEEEGSGTAAGSGAAAVRAQGAKAMGMTVLPSEVPEMMNEMWLQVDLEDTTTTSLHYHENQTDLLEKGLLLPKKSKDLTRSFSSDAGRNMDNVPTSRYWSNILDAVSYDGQLVTPPSPFRAPSRTRRKSPALLSSSLAVSVGNPVPDRQDGSVSGSGALTERGTLATRGSSRSYTSAPTPLGTARARTADAPPRPMTTPATTRMPAAPTGERGRADMWGSKPRKRRNKMRRHKISENANDWRLLLSNPVIPMYRDSLARD